MTFVAERVDGGVVAAARANADDEHRCLECGNRVVLRSAHRRVGELVRPHFMHPAGGESCSTGESEEHRWMKAVAFAKAQEQWPDADVEYEGFVVNRPGGVNRRADVLVVFNNRGFDVKTPDGRFDLKKALDITSAVGLAIECQHHNESKDVELVTKDYLKAGYNVLWLVPGYFDKSIQHISFTNGWPDEQIGQDYVYFLATTERSDQPYFRDDGKLQRFINTGER